MPFAPAGLHALLSGLGLPALDRAFARQTPLDPARKTCFCSARLNLETYIFEQSNKQTCLSAIWGGGRGGFEAGAGARLEKDFFWSAIEWARF